MGAPMISRRKTIAIGIETTKGTAVSLSAAMSNSVVYDAKMTVGDIFGEGEREPGLSSSGTLESVPGPQMGQFSFTSDVVFNDLTMTGLQACGMVVSGAGPYTAVPSADTTAHKTVTAALWEGGRKKLMRGCSGNAVIRASGAGQRLQIDWTFSGIFDSVTDEAMPSDVIGGKGWRNAGVAFTLGGAAVPLFDGFDINLGAEVAEVEDNTDATAIDHYLVAQVKPRLTIAPQADLVANHDAYGKFLAGTAEAMSMVFTDAASKTLTITAPKAQRISIGDEERERKLIDPIECMLHVSSGNDQLSIVESA